MKIALTGSSGGIGRAIIKQARADGHELVCIDRVAAPETEAAPEAEAAPEPAAEEAPAKPKRGRRKKADVEAEAAAHAGHADRLEHHGPERPVPVRLREEVQEVPRRLALTRARGAAGRFEHDLDCR